MLLSSSVCFLHVHCVLHVCIAEAVSGKCFRDTVVVGSKFSEVQTAYAVQRCFSSSIVVHGIDCQLLQTA